MTSRALQLTIFCLPVLFQASEAHAVIPQDGLITFQILRNGDPFGMHTLNFSKDGKNTVVDIDIAMKAGVGPITLFRYEHTNREVWHGDNPVSLASTTHDDGDDYIVKAEWTPLTMTVTVNNKPFEAPAPLLPTSYWNPVFLQTQNDLLNTQKGRIEPIKVQKIGVEEIEVGGEIRKADHYKIKATLNLDIWYDQKTRQWVGLKFKVRGSDLEYRRLDPI